jgi:hypothetical protein
MKNHLKQVSGENSVRYALIQSICEKLLGKFRCVYPWEVLDEVLVEVVYFSWRVIPFICVKLNYNTLFSGKRMFFMLFPDLFSSPICCFLCLFTGWDRL